MSGERSNALAAGKRIRGPPGKVVFAMSRINGDRRVRRIRFQAARVRVPLWMLLLAVAGKALVLSVRWCWRHRVAVVVALGLVLFVHCFGPLGLVALLVGLVLAAIVWRRAHHRSFSLLIWWVWGRARLAFVYRRRWRPAMVHTGLAIRTPISSGDQVIFDEYFPRIRAIQTAPGLDILRVELLPGQTPDEWAEQAEALRHVFRAWDCEVHAEVHRFIRLRFRRHGVIHHSAASDALGSPEAPRIPPRRLKTKQSVSGWPASPTHPGTVRTGCAQRSEPVMTGGWIPDLSPYANLEGAGEDEDGDAAGWRRRHEAA